MQHVLEAFERLAFEEHIILGTLHVARINILIGILLLALVPRNPYPLPFNIFAPQFFVQLIRHRNGFHSREIVNADSVLLRAPIVYSLFSYDDSLAQTDLDSLFVETPLQSPLFNHFRLVVPHRFRLKLGGYF